MMFLQNVCFFIRNNMQNIFQAARSQMNRNMVAARALATYLILGCVGRGVRFGSESSSGSGGAGAGGGWKSGNLEIWEFGDLGSYLEIQKCGSNISKSVLPKMSTRSGLVGTQILLAPFGAIPGIFFHGPTKSKKCTTFAYFPWWANGPYSPGLGPCCYPPRVGE